MIRLIVSDLKEHAATWIAVFAVAVACGFIGGWSMSFQQTSLGYEGPLRWRLQVATSMSLMVSIPIAFIVLASASGLTVSVQRRSYALWQLANVRPGTVRNLVLAQLAVVTLLGSILGTIFAAATFPPLMPLACSTGDLYKGVVPRVGYQFMPLVWTGVPIVSVLGGLRGARAAARTSPLVALREPKPAYRGMTRVRIFLFAGISACIMLIFSFMVHVMVTEPSTWVYLTYCAILLIMLVPAGAASAAPLLLSVVLSMWTALIPDRHLNAWYLARHTARHGLSASTSTETPMMVGFGAVAGLYALARIFWTYAQTHPTPIKVEGSIDLTTGIILLGGPILLCAIGVATSILMTSGERRRDVALLVAAGASNKTIFAAAVFEALIHVVTATLVGVFCAGAISIIVNSTLGQPLFTGLSLNQGLIVSAAGLVLVLFATVVPTMQVLRVDAAKALDIQG